MTVPLPSDPTPEPLRPTMVPPASLTTVMSVSAVTPCRAPEIRPPDRLVTVTPVRPPASMASAVPLAPPLVLAPKLRMIPELSMTASRPGRSASSFSASITPVARLMTLSVTPAVFIVRRSSA